MTQRVQVVISDNLDYHERDQVHTDADETLTISLDGEVRRLDLTTEHALELRSFLKRYIDAGDDPGQAPLPAEPPQHQDGAAQVSGWRVNRGMREWADRNMPDSYARRGPDRTGYVYDPALIRAYQGYLRSVGHPWQHHPVFASLGSGRS